MSFMSLAALLVYFTVACACLIAVPGAARQFDRPGDKIHWLGCATLLSGIAAERIANLEDTLRKSARELLRVGGGYDERAVWQVPLALAIATIGLALVLVLVRSWQRSRRGSRTRLILLSRWAVCAFVPLFGLRLVSLHQVDRLLYTGPLRINWLLEGIICLTVGSCAVLYAQRFGKRVPSRR